MTSIVAPRKDQRALEQVIPAEPAEKELYRWGGISALIFAAGYVVIIALYAVAGAPPTGGEAWLNYLVGKTTIWWAIVGLSILTDVLLLPFALSLYLSMKNVNRNAMFLASGLVGLFVFLDLAVTWPNYSALITLSSGYAAATSSAQQATYIAAANYASSVLSSSTEAVYSILTLSLGILVAGIVMSKGRIFNKAVGYLGVVTGVLGVLSVAGSSLSGSLGELVIVTSLLTMVWVFLVGYRLLRAT